MFEQTPWLEREFRFGLDVGLFPCLLARFEGTPARAEELARSVPAEMLTRRPRDAWSIQEHIGHLLDLEELGKRRLDDYERGAPELTPADMSNRKTWASDHNSRTIEEILSEFREARRSLVSRLEAWGEAEVARSAIHARLGQPLRVVDWLYFMAEHDDHHIAAARRLALELGGG